MITKKFGSLTYEFNSDAEMADAVRVWGSLPMADNDVFEQYLDDQEIDFVYFIIPSQSDDMMEYETDLFY